jgi:hypothetical protein
MRDSRTCGAWLIERLLNQAPDSRDKEVKERMKGGMTDAELLRRIAAGEPEDPLIQALATTRASLRRRLRKAEKRLPISLRAEEVAVQLQGLVENHRTLEELRDECLRRLRNSEGRIELSFGEPREGDAAASGKPAAGEEKKGGAGAKKTENPVALLLQTLDAMRQHLAMIAQLTDRMYEAKEVEWFEERVFAVIDAADPAIAERIRVLVSRRDSLPEICEADGTAES